MEKQSNQLQASQGSILKPGQEGNAQRAQGGNMQLEQGGNALRETGDSGKTVQAERVEAGHSGTQHHQHAIVRPKRDMSHIKGWGADLDHKNRPAYPMERTPPRLEGVHWDEPEQQPVKDTVFHSTERPDITPVFGTSTPPRGVSGAIRKVAYKYAENDLRHWLMLLFADRVNVVEGVFQDLGHGKVPNVFDEIGLKAKMKHDPAGLARSVAVGSVAIGLAYYMLKRRNSRNF